MKNARFAVFLLLFSLLNLGAQPIPVEIVKDSLGNFSLIRGGETFYIYGAGGTNVDLLPELASRGGNSIRTWGVSASSGQLLREAEKNGITVMLGLWMKKEKDGFDYNDTVAVAAQLENFRNYVRSFRNYPALLAWSIGNEVEMGYSNYKVWNAVNDIAKMIKEEDGNHPTLTITASISTSKANAIAQRAPDLDMLGVNAYASISGVHSAISNSQWDKAYLITEWGVNGPWETAKTSWGAPLEANTTEKAEMFMSRYENYIKPHPEVLPGSYAFYWNSKFEATETWFGLFVRSQSTPMVDALEYSWTGELPENRAPEITNLYFNSELQQSSVTVKGRLGNLVSIESNDPDGDELSYEFLIKPESGNELVESIEGATFDVIPGLGAYSETNSMLIDFEDIHNQRNLRLYALVRDGMGHVATATFPFPIAFAANDTTLIRHDTLSTTTRIFEKIKVYPNPAKEKIYLSSSMHSEAISLRLISSKGNLLYEEEVNMKSGMYTLDISSYHPGLLLLELKDDKMGRQYFKIFKY